MTLHDINPYLALILVGFLPNEMWRWLGILISRGLDENSEIVVFVRAIATAILAGVIARLIFIAPGALATIALPVRIGAVAFGFCVFLMFKRSIFAGVVAGEVALIAGAMLMPM